MQIYFLFQKKILLDLKSKPWIKLPCLLLSLEKIKINKGESLNFYATLGKNSESCQELPTLLPTTKKCTIKLYNGTIQAQQ